MTRKDYEAIAKVLNEYRKDTEQTTTGENLRTRLDTIGDVVEILSDLFQAENPSFQPNRFYFACNSEMARGN